MKILLFYLNSFMFTHIIVKLKSHSILLYKYRTNYLSIVIFDESSMNNNEELLSIVIVLTKADGGYKYYNIFNSYLNL
jgi:hypothetical protein